MPTRRFDFPDARGLRLSGNLEEPEGLRRGWALFAHCFTCGKGHLAAVRIARTLAGAGIGVLRFDFSGIGGSEGDFEDTTFTSNVQDLVSAARAMRDAGIRPQLLVGHSLGGAAVLASAGQIDSVRAVATIAAPFEVASILRHLDLADRTDLEAGGVQPARVKGRLFAVGPAFVDDARAQDQGGRIAKLRRPLLLLHSPRDQVVDIENATRIFLAARHPKSFISLEEADHLLTRKGDAEHAASLISTWAAPHLSAEDHAHAHPFSAEAEETGAGKYQLAMRSGGVHWLADEPVSMGGLGSGPTPYDLLSSSLAACTTMTLRQFADSRGWPVERIRTAVSHRKAKAASIPDVFSRHIFIEGLLDDAQRAQLLEAAQRCPVHRTLQQGATMQQAILDASG